MANDRHYELILRDSVGLGGHNAQADIKALQTCLNDIGDTFHLSSPLALDGSLGRVPERSATVAAIRAFQHFVVGMPSPDGRIDKGGRSHRKINSCLQAAQSSLLDVGQVPHLNSDTVHSPVISSPVMNSPSEISAKGMDLLQNIETLATSPYDDQTGCTINQWCAGATIGYGHLIARHEWNSYRNGVSTDQAHSLFYRDLQPFIDAVKTNVITPLRQNEFDALVIFAFNIGTSGLASSSVVAMINNPDVDTPYDTLENAWKAWSKSQGKVMQGLVHRRACEWNMYSHGVYEKW